jgi:tRNA_anti-like
MAFLSDLTQNLWYIFACGYFAGLATALWVVWLFPEKKKDVDLFTQLPLRTAANIAPVSAQIEAKVPKPKKVFVNVSPSYLVGFYNNNRTKVQGDEYVAAYIGKWIPVTGTVCDIRTTVTGTLYVQIVDNDRIFISATLNEESSETISHIARGAKITVRGEIYLVDKSGVMLRTCELDETSPS